jgi:hypothetical protein
VRDDAKLNDVRVMQSKPVVAAPAKHAANRMQCKHAENAIERPQLGLFELQGIALRTFAPDP